MRGSGAVGNPVLSLVRSDVARKGKAKKKKSGGEGAIETKKRREETGRFNNYHTTHRRPADLKGKKKKGEKRRGGRGLASCVDGLQLWGSVHQAKKGKGGEKKEVHGGKLFSPRVGGKGGIRGGKKRNQAVTGWVELSPTAFLYVGWRALLSLKKKKKKKRKIVEKKKGKKIGPRPATLPLRALT